LRFSGKVRGKKRGAVTKSPNKKIKTTTQLKKKKKKKKKKHKAGIKKHQKKTLKER